jgi:hypothetical protein
LLRRGEGGEGGAFVEGDHQVVISNKGYTSFNLMRVALEELEMGIITPCAKY